MEAGRLHVGSSTFQHHPRKLTPRNIDIHPNYIPTNIPPISIAKTKDKKKKRMRRTNGGAKKIPLGGIKTLTFYADKYTAGRRTAPIRQSPRPFVYISQF